MVGGVAPFSLFFFFFFFPFATDLTGVRKLSHTKYQAFCPHKKRGCVSALSKRGRVGTGGIPGTMYSSPSPWGRRDNAVEYTPHTMYRYVSRAAYPHANYCCAPTLAAPPPGLCPQEVGLASVGNDTVECAAHRSLRELDNQGTAFFSPLFFSWRSPTAGRRVIDHLCEVKNLYSARGNRSCHVVFKERHPRGSYIVLPLLSLEVTTPEIK